MELWMAEIADPRDWDDLGGKWGEKKKGLMLLCGALGGIIFP